MLEAKERRAWQVVLVLLGAPSLYLLIFLASSVDLETFTSFAFLAGMLTEYLFLGIVLVFLRRAKISLSNLGLSKSQWKRNLLLGTVLGVLLMFAFILLDAVISRYIPTFPGTREARPLWAAIAFGMGLFTAFGPIEEIIWRGYCITELQKISGKTWIAVVTASISFGFMHWWGGPSLITVNVIIGTLFSIIYLRWRSLTVNIIAHIVADLPTLIFMLITSTG